MQRRKARKINIDRKQSWSQGCEEGMVSNRVVGEEATECGWVNNVKTMGWNNRKRRHDSILNIESLKRGRRD